MHFRENPDHNIARNIGTQKVWDYKADNWVFDPQFFPPAIEGFNGFASQEEADEALARQVGGKSLEQMSLNSKLEAIGTEYNYVLVSLLDSQKQWEILRATSYTVAMLSTHLVCRYYEGIIEGWEQLFTCSTFVDISRVIRFHQLILMIRLKTKPGTGQGAAASAQVSATADAAQKRRLEENREKMSEDASLGQVFSLTHSLRENLRLQLQETDSLFQSTKAQQDEYLKKIASLEAERDRLKAQVAELQETNRDLCTHLATGRYLDPRFDQLLP
jgi:hypothetical protein